MVAKIRGSEFEVSRSEYQNKTLKKRIFEASKIYRARSYMERLKCPSENDNKIF